MSKLFLDNFVEDCGDDVEDKVGEDDDRPVVGREEVGEDKTDTEEHPCDVGDVNECFLFHIVISFCYYKDTTKN